MSNTRHETPAELRLHCCDCDAVKYGYDHCCTDHDPSRAILLDLLAVLKTDAPRWDCNCVVCVATRDAEDRLREVSDE